jgi:hypothetical protein
MFIQGEAQDAEADFLIFYSFHFFPKYKGRRVGTDRVKIDTERSSVVDP